VRIIEQMKAVSILIAVFTVITYMQSVYAHTADIKDISGGEYISVPISADMYRYCGSDLGDLRIYDKDGNTVPYFIQSFIPSERKSDEKLYPLKTTDSFVKDRELYFDYAAAEEYPSDICADTLEFKVSVNNFAKTADIYGGYDGMVWEYICRDNLYSVEGAEKLSVRFSQPKKYTHYRIKLSDSGEYVKFEDAVLHYYEEVPSELYFTAEADMEYTVEERDGVTVVHIPQAENMCIDRIEINSDDMFKRRVSYSGGYGFIQRLVFGDETVTASSIAVNGMRAGGNFSFMIENGDDKPINIKGIRIVYYENYVIFRADNPPYRAEFGIKAEKPVYDIGDYKDEVLMRLGGKGEFSDIVVEEEKKGSSDINKGMIFNVTVSVLAVFLMVVLVISIKKGGE